MVTRQAYHTPEKVRAYKTSEAGRLVARRAQRRFKFKHKYGITEEQYAEMERQQDGKCAICGGPPNGRGALHVDHVHGTQLVRGLLCHSCNTGLGLFKDDPELFMKAIEYIKLGQKKLTNG